MRLFRIMIVSAALLDLALLLATPGSPLDATSPTQAVGLSSENVELAPLNHR